MKLDGSVIFSGGVIQTKIKIAVVNSLFHLETRGNFKHIIDGQVEEEVDIPDRFLRAKLDPDLISNVIDNFE